MKTKPQNLKTGFLKGDLRYYVHHSYQTERDCEREGCDSICRCSTIEDLRVSEVDLHSMIEAATEGIKTKDPILTYCVTRILMLDKDLSDPRMYEAHTERGYYGEEIGNTTLNDRVADRIVQSLTTLESLKTNKERVQYVLELEYGFLLPELKDVTDWHIQTIHLDQMAAGDQMRRVDRKRVNSYVETFGRDKPVDYPVALTLCFDAFTYRLIDGYHRVTAAKELKLKKIQVLVNK